jgi:hypothetical protein
MKGDSQFCHSAAMGKISYANVRDVLHGDVLFLNDGRDFPYGTANHLSYALII